MFCIENAAKAKKSARSLEKFFKKSGVELVHGHALNAVATMAGFEDWNAMLESLNQATPAPASASEPRITDIDFQKVSTIRVWGSEYNFDINSTTWDAFRNGSETEPQVLLDENEVILELQSLNDDVYGDEELTVSELLDFKWNGTRQCFTNSQGQNFEALILTQYDFDTAPPGPSIIAPPYVKEFVEAKPEVKRYKVYVYCNENFVGKHECIASSKALAEEAAMDELWDDRVERYEARLFSEQMEDKEGGSFAITADNIFCDEVESFDEACRKAKMWAEASPWAKLVVWDGDEKVIHQLSNDQVAECSIYLDNELVYAEDAELSVAYAKAEAWSKENPGRVVELRSDVLPTGSVKVNQ